MFVPVCPAKTSILSAVSDMLNCVARFTALDAFGVSALAFCPCRDAEFAEYAKDRFVANAINGGYLGEPHIFIPVERTQKRVVAGDYDAVVSSFCHNR